MVLSVEPSSPGNSPVPLEHRLPAVRRTRLVGAVLRRAATAPEVQTHDAPGTLVNGKVSNDPCASSTNVVSMPVNRRRSIARWCQEREMPDQQFVGVLRHTERADASWAMVKNELWHRTADFAKWPYDPPLSDDGVQAAQQLGERVLRITQNAEVMPHIIVCSPYLRCVQTAVEVCSMLGPHINLLIDYSLGEIYGPAGLGTSAELESQSSVVRPMEYVIALCQQRGINCLPQPVGHWPEWPEQLLAARRRFARRYITYLRRSIRVRRNFLIVSHADCVGATLSMMPSEADVVIEKVEFGGMFIAQRSLREASDHDGLRRKSAPPRLQDKLPEQGWFDEATRKTSAGFQESNAEWMDVFTRMTSGNSVETDAESIVGVTPMASGSPQESNTEWIDDLAPATSGASQEWWRSEETYFMSEYSHTPSGVATSSGPVPGPFKVACGWQVQRFGIMHVPAEDSNGAMLDRRLRHLVDDGHFTRQLVEKLLCHHLSSTPLGGDGEDDAQEDIQGLASLTLSHNASFSDSTVLFGASKSDLGSPSDVPSRSATITDFRGCRGDECATRNCDSKLFCSDQPTTPVKEGNVGGVSAAVLKPFVLMNSTYSLIAKRRSSKDIKTGMPQIYYAGQAACN